MQIFRKKIDHADLEALPVRDVARCCGVAERTARLWKQRGAPPAAARLLALAIGDMETMFGRDWRGWWMRGAVLESPDGQDWTPGRLGAWWIERQQIPTLQRQLERYRAGVPIIDRGELERLQTAAQAAQRFAREMAGLYPDGAASSGQTRDAPPARRLAVGGQ